MRDFLFWSLLPAITFIALSLWERLCPATAARRSFSTGDWIMNLSGFFVQGVIVPAAGYLLATQCLPGVVPHLHARMHIGFAGAFFLNFVGMDFLYYLQHRLFHRVPWLWKLHAPHHYSPMVNIWATSRNAILTNFLFVYLLVSPWFAYMCDSPDGFFVGAMVTAALDLFRHANIRIDVPIVRGIFLLPQDHHRHHDADKSSANYGANFIIWDRLFGTADMVNRFPESYAAPNAPDLTTQLFCPWRS